MTGGVLSRSTIRRAILLKSKTAQLTGASIPVDGGWTAQ